MVISFKLPGLSIDVPDLKDLGIDPDDQLGALLCYWTLFFLEC